MVAGTLFNVTLYVHCLVLLNNNCALLNTLLMPYEAHFCLSGYVNKQNCLDWAPNNTHELQGHPLHRWQVTARCASSPLGNTGSFFFDKAEGRTVNLNAERYIVMLRTFLRNDVTSSFAVIPIRYSVGIIAAAHTAQISMKDPELCFQADSFLVLGI
jgi:hypothetical protein